MGFMGQSVSNDQFIEKLIRRTAQAAIGQSSLRNQGSSGVILAAREAVAKINLGELGQLTEFSYHRYLDEATERLMASFPDGARNWGAARKALNLFLRDATYNVDLSERFRLDVIRPLLEVPLDKDVATGLRLQCSDLPSWKTIKHLQPVTSSRYQSVASAVAQQYNVYRVDLDVFFWRAVKPR